MSDGDRELAASSGGGGIDMEAYGATYRLRYLDIPPDTYDVVAELQRFTTVRRSFTVAVGSEVTLASPLAVATVQETVTVTGQTPLVELTQTEQGTQFTATEVANLPVNSRDFTEFALLSPGVVRGRSQGAGWGSQSGFSASGNRGDQNAINIDGLVNKSMDNGSENGNFSQAAVQEFQVVTQSAPAEYGGSAGGVINAVTRSGTNQLAGDGFFFLRHNALDKPPFDLETGSDGIVRAVPEPEADEFRRTVAGFAVGGPIRRDKAFFFGVLDRTDNNEPRVRTILPSTIELVRQRALPDLARLPEGLRPRFIAGHSLGEFSALVAAGALPFRDALRLVAERGRLAATNGARGAMAAVVGLPVDEVERVIAAAVPDGTAVVANDNGPQHVTIAGAQASIAVAADALVRRGAKRVVQLRISGAFHCPPMARIGDDLRTVMAGLTFRDPVVPVVANVSARPCETAAAIPETLVRHLSQRVEWLKSVRFMAERGASTFVEIGAGQVVNGLIRRIADVELLNVSDPSSIRQALERLRARLA
jgi:[acyl-carrier-protein] S-malonyltransferase